MEEQGLKIDSNVVELIGTAEDTLTGPQFRRFVSPVVGEIYKQAKLKDIEIEKLQTQLDKANESLGNMTEVCDHLQAELDELKEPKKEE